MKENAKDQKVNVNKPGQKSKEQNKGNHSKKPSSSVTTEDFDKWNSDELDFGNETDVENNSDDREKNSRGKYSPNDY